MNIIDIAQISMSTYRFRILQCQIFRHKECSHILFKLKIELRIPKYMYFDASRGIWCVRDSLSSSWTTRTEIFTALRGRPSRDVRAARVWRLRFHVHYLKNQRGNNGLTKYRMYVIINYLNELQCRIGNVHLVINVVNRFEYVAGNS